MADRENIGGGTIATCVPGTQTTPSGTDGPGVPRLAAGDAAGDSVTETVVVGGATLEDGEGPALEVVAGGWLAQLPSTEATTATDSTTIDPDGLILSVQRQ